MQENNFDFNSCLLDDEKILYQGRPTPGEGGKQVGGSLVVICFSLFMLGLLIWSLVTKTGDGANGINLTYIIIFAVVLLFLGLGIYSLIYNLFLKKRLVADDFYCITNMRALKYESGKNKLVFGYLACYNNIGCENIKNNYGDLSMAIEVDDDAGEDAASLLQVKDMLLHPDPENMPFLVFQSIENPEAVCQIAIKARDEVMKNVNSEMVESSTVSEL